MTSDSENRFSLDHDLQALHEALTTPTVDSTDSDPGPDPDDQLGSALDASMFSPTVRRYVDELLLRGEVPTPATRQKLITAARRGLTHRRAAISPLPVLLASRRVDEGITIAQVADALGRPVADIYKMESGSTSVRDLEPEMIVSWTRVVNADPALAIDALRRVLELSTPSPTAIAAGRGRQRQISSADEKLIERVSTLLQL